MSRSLFLVCFVGFSTAFPFHLPSSVSGSRIWALLATGSNGWGNYADQASVCRAYQIFRSRGVPNENIVVMMFDDIAYNDQFWDVPAAYACTRRPADSLTGSGLRSRCQWSIATARNPEPGVIRTREGGPNVYPGVLHDYTNLNVSYKNFLRILKGEVHELKGIGSGKALQSGPDDYVFVYLASHGGPGFVAFIDGELTTEDLVSSIVYMKDHTDYKEMAVFIEACNSGSMFYKALPNDVRVYGMTAANPFEPSFASNWDQSLGTYRCLYYSCGWMDFVENMSQPEDTLKTLFTAVKRAVNESHVSVYGEKSDGEQPVANFFGQQTEKQTQEAEQGSKVQHTGVRDAVSRGDIPLAILSHKILSTKDDWTKAKLERELRQELELRKEVREKLKSIVEETLAETGTSSERVELALHQSASPTHFKCLKQVLSHFSANCYSFNEVSYAAHVSGPLSNLCDAGVPTKRIIQSMQTVCSQSL